MEIIRCLLMIIVCHLIGDYVLQGEFLAATKGKNWYHLIIHCILYCLPFYFVFGFTWQIIYIFAIHIATDAAKARYGTINYATDQIVHYLAALSYLSI